MSHAVFGYPHGDPLNSYTDREAREERYQQAREKRERFGEAGGDKRKDISVINSLLLPTADELLLLTGGEEPTPDADPNADSDSDNPSPIGNSQRQAIVFDIETGPLPEDVLRTMFEPLPPFDPASVKVGNLKDQAKIDAKISESKAAHEEECKAAESRFFDRAALSAHTGEVLAIGVRFAGEKGAMIIEGQKERALLETFWTVCEDTRASDNRLVGFNVFGFDLPFLLRRSWLAGVRAPHWIMDRDRYWSPVFVDLMARWQCGDRQNFISLDRLSKLLGVGAKNGDGARFAELLKADREAAMAYLNNDLELTLQVARRLGVVG